ncbi:MAG TPA: SusD/RagB family nutrient-binding outer membrane lipoprotein [Bacteroidales bacterium]|jgi:hypothetical protein|nr:SusD/RagB family nutrient-binding outer membrane lipoprotein [Bacteroidales bacterium]HOS71829.1 SusD/RagB family nutrient-binding outer membrane lipoprotein [Bacteroidales bacterium]HQH23491.1 SusD/RagB family nutrient-binding outer membrane lipoprotein [Bacteroidales bacterium]HQJ82067.1 SusD/RagB family nutrient-binding outer membrane lipoprotein [Bacteroidales bacterium]
MKKIISLAVLVVLLGACTKNFDEINSNPYQITQKSLEQDFNHIGAYFQGLLANLQGHQVEEDLLTDSFVRHFGTPTPFVSNRNNTTYYVTWNSFWGRIYNSVMSPSKQVIEIAQEGGYDVFEHWAKLLQVIGLSRLTAYHGPLIYSEYGKTTTPIYYDSEKDLYNSFFKVLDDVSRVFKNNPDYKGLIKFDASYKGKISSWLKLVNSMRLRLAIRLSKVDPALAKEQGEKAIADDAGLILTNADNFNISLYGGKMPIAVICFEWQDSKMSAGMEEFLIGLKDPRIHKYFAPATDESLYASHPDFPYKGIASGAYLNAKDDHEKFSNVSEDWKSVTSRRFFTAAEVHFALAEAALRGWAGAGDAREHYETGIKMSFADWGAGGVDAYLADATSKPINYVDPIDARNNYNTRSTVTVAWDETADNEIKLEKIITQKWIDALTNANEVWCDHRRTGYPKLHYVPKNDSNEDWGVIPADGFIQRMPFVEGERNSNPQGVADAASKLRGGKDVIGATLYFAPPDVNTNFPPIP